MTDHDPRARRLLTRFLRFSAVHLVLVLGVVALLGWLLEGNPTDLLVFGLVIWAVDQFVEGVRAYREFRRRAADR